MRRIRLCAVLLFLVLAMTAEAAHEVRFVSEIKAENPFYVAAGPDGLVYVTGRKGSSYLPGGDGFIYVYDREGKNILTIGGQDSTGGSYLKKPAGIAFYEGDLYVCDTSQDKIIIFSKDGKYRDSFGESGSAVKQFRNPEGIFVYQGIIYVADTDNDRIQVFGSNGVFLRSIGNTGDQEATLKNPIAVAVDSRAMIYAVDGASRQVKIYKQDGSFAGKLTGPVKPRALAMTDDGLLVTDAENYNITKYNTAGDKLYSFGTMGQGKVQFQELYGIAADGQGKVYAVDRSRGAVQIISNGKGAESDLPIRISPPTSVRWESDLPVKAGKLAWDRLTRRIFAVDDEQEALLVISKGVVEKTIGAAGVAPVAVAVDPKGFPWVIDRKESRILKLDSDGRVLISVGASGRREGYFSRPADVLIGTDGRIFVADRNNHRVQVFSSEGVFLNAFTKAADERPLEHPVALSQDANGNLYVLCEEQKKVVSLTSDGKALREIGSDSAQGYNFDVPVGLAVDGSELMVLDAGTRSIKVFTLTGAFLREIGARGNAKGDFQKPAALAVLDHARFVVSDPAAARIQTFSVRYTPSAPDGLAVKPDMRAVDVTWNPSQESFIETYRVFRRQEGEPLFREVGATGKNHFRDNTVLPDKKYFYRVSARSDSGRENMSAESTPAVPMKYTPPSPVELKAASQEWSVNLSWNMTRTDHIDHYRIYRDRDGDPLLGQPKTNTFTEGGLESDVSYTYQVSAVSIDGLESDPVAVTIRTLVAVKPPLEIDILQMSDIFSNTYKIYETEGIGKVRLTNNTQDPIPALKLAFHIKEYMDFPTEAEVKNLLPGESREIIFKAVFNNKILEVTEDTPVQTELTAAYYVNQKLRRYSKSHTVKLYEKHRMMWTQKDRIAIFVTSKDPVVLEFTRAVVTQYGDIASALVYAGAIYDYMGQMGMTYIKHPNNPYQIVEGKTSFVDYVQYPRDTLKRNSGVCTDLVVLYAAALEGLGIRTMILGTPDHLFMMFAVGEASDLGETTMNNMFAIHEGTIWAPVELTLVGSSFMKAWEKGSKTYYEWKKKGLEMTDLASAWTRYKPTTLPHSDWRVPVAPRAEVDKRYNDEMNKLAMIWLKHTSNRYYLALAHDPKDANAYLQLGIIYGEAGDLPKAQSYFEKAESLMADNAEIKNNIGNLLYLKGRYDEARKAYEKASRLDPSDPYILVNLSLCYLKLNKKEMAAQVFKKAVEKDAEIAKKHRTLAVELM